MATQTTTSSTKRSKLEDTYNYATPSNQGGIQKLSEYKNIVNQNQSALSSLQGAKEQALKAADVSALAQGYGTQGAYQQNIGNIQSAYLNRVGQQQQVAQQQIGALQDVASTNAFQNFSTALANAEAQGTLNTDQLNTLQSAYFNQMNASDLANARLLIDQYNRNIAQEEGISNVYEKTTPSGKLMKVDINELVNNPNKVPTIAVNGQTINTSKLKYGNTVSSAVIDPNSMKLGEVRIARINGNDTIVIKTGDNELKEIVGTEGSKVANLLLGKKVASQIGKGSEDYQKLLAALKGEQYIGSSSATNVGSNYKNALREEFERRNRR